MTHQEAVETFATERYLLNEMSEADRAAFEEHYFSCEDCAQDVRTAEDFRDAARDVLRRDRERRPGTGKVLDSTARAGTKWYRSTVIPWTLAAALAGIAVYQPFSVKDGSAKDGSAYALNPVTIRPDSRGEPPVVPASPDVNAFYLEVNGVAPGTDLTLDIKNAAGRAIPSRPAKAPPVGASLLLLLTDGTQPEPGSYVITLTDNATRQVVGTYRLTLK